ncbi:hypothetical protein ACP4OV_002837 [Aristida adscensionis]
MDLNGVHALVFSLMRTVLMRLKGIAGQIQGKFKRYPNGRCCITAGWPEFTNEYNIEEGVYALMFRWSLREEGVLVMTTMKLG